MKAVEEPAFLTVGTDVSAKYRGAFCEAKIKTVKRLVKVKVTLKGEGTSQVVHDDQVKGQLRVGSVVEVKTNEGGNSEAVISKLTDASLYTVVFDDGDEKTLRRTSLCLKGERHFAESETLDQLPLTNPEHFGTPVIGKKSNRGRRSSQLPVAEEEQESSSSSSSSEEEEEGEGGTDELLGTVCSVDQSETGLVLVLSPVCNEELVVKKDQCLVRSFGDGKFSTVLRRHLHTLNSASICKPEHAHRKGVCEAQSFLRTRAVPEVWKMDLSQILESSSDSDDKHSEEEEERGEEEREEEREERRERRKKRLQEEPDDPEPDPAHRDLFLQQLYKFMEDRGTPINKPPVLGYKDLNLFKLFRLVMLQGGCDSIESGTVWKQIYTDLGIPVLNSAAAYNVKTAYKKYLFGFEAFCRSALITFRTIHHNSPPTSPANQRAPPDAKSSPAANQRPAGAELKDSVKTETESESESERSERHLGPRGRRGSMLLPLKDKRGTDSDEQREPRKRTPRQTDQSERTPRLTDQSESGGRLSDQSERGSDDDEDEEDEEDEPPHQPTEKSEEDPDGVTGTRVRVKYGRGKTQKIYEAHIKKTDVDNGENFYLVHYYGWNVRYDEWVKADRIIWPSDKGSKKKRRGRHKMKEEVALEEDTPPPAPPAPPAAAAPSPAPPAAAPPPAPPAAAPVKSSGGRRGRPLGSKNKTNGRAPERPGLSNGDKPPRRRTRRTSGMYDSDRASNEDSGNSSDDSESEDSTKKPFLWRRPEAGPKQEVESRVKQEEEEPSRVHPSETTAPSVHQDSHSQSEQRAGPEQLSISPDKKVPPPVLLDPSPRLKLLTSVPLMPRPPHSEPMIVLHHCLPPDSDTDSASESDSSEEEEVKRSEEKRRNEETPGSREEVKTGGRREEEKRRSEEMPGRREEVKTGGRREEEKRRSEETPGEKEEETGGRSGNEEVQEEEKEVKRQEEVKSPAKLLNKSPLRDRTLNRTLTPSLSPQKDLSQSPLRPTRTETERPDQDQSQGEIRPERPEVTQATSNRPEEERTTEDQNQRETRPETEPETPPKQDQDQDRDQGQDQGQDQDHDRDQDQDLDQDQTPVKRKAPEQKSPEKKLKTNVSPKTTNMSPSPKTTNMSPSPKTTNMAASPKTANMSPSPKTTNMASSPKAANMSPKTTNYSPSPKTTNYSPSPKTTNVSPKTTNMVASPKAANMSPKTTNYSSSPKITNVSPKTTNMADTAVQKEEVELCEAKGEVREEEVTGEEREEEPQEMGADALVCHEVDLDEPEEREKERREEREEEEQRKEVKRREEEVQREEEEERAKAVSASEQLLLMMRESHLQLPPKAPPTMTSVLPTAPIERRGAESANARGNETSPSSNTCDRGQKRVLEGHHSPTVKKHKRHKRPAPHKHDKNGAGGSSDSEDQTHKHCVSPTSRGRKWSLSIDDLESLSSSERISFLQDKLQEIRKYYLSLKSEVASIDRRRRRLKKKERQVSHTTSSSSDAALSPSSSSPSQSSLAVEVR